MAKQNPFTLFRAFGWIICRSVRPDGSVTRITIDADKPREQANYITLYTQGYLHNKCLTDDLPVLDRSPGTFSKNLQTYRAGVYELTAEGDVAWWCIDKANNNDRLPDVEPIIMQPGEERIFNANDKVMLCQGAVIVNGFTLQGPAVIKDNLEEFSVQAQTAVYGFKFL